jgi:sugar phosphate isomerase/epimerase
MRAASSISPFPRSLAASAAALPGDLRSMLDRLRTLGVRAVQLDAAAPELDPTMLSASGRRDVLASLRRRELLAAGLDCPVRVTSLADPGTSDAAIARVIDVIRLAADLGRLGVSVRLPAVSDQEPGGPRAAAAPAAVPPAGGGLIIAAAGDADLHAAVAALAPAAAAPTGRREAAGVDASVIDALTAAAERYGVPLIDHAVPPRRGDGRLVPGLDVAACLAAGLDPVLAFATTPDVAAVRLSDLTADGRRVAPGDPEGRLPLEAFAAAVTTGGFDGPVVLDVRQCRDPWAATLAGGRAWTEHLP